MSNKPFPFSVCKQCCNGDASPEQIAQAVEEYMKKHPITETDPTVPYWAKQPNKPIYTAEEINAAHRMDLGNVKELEIGNDAVEGINLLYRNKADKATTYTKDEVVELIKNSGGGSTEAVLYEDVVNTPEWDNQPTFEGTLDSAINTEDFFYVTLKDASGASLPAGQFMLKDTRETDATIYSTVFSLPNLATGEETLVENYPVEFTESGKMRSAGVWRAQYTLTDWLLKGSTGSVKITAIGEYVQRTNNAFFTSVFTANNNVSCYHSAHNTASQSDSTKQIVPYALLSVANYKVNRFYDESILQRNGDETFTFARKGFLRYIKEGETGYTVTNFNTVGFGDILTDTKLSSVSIQSSGSKNNGFIRNGSIIRVSEVV